MRWQCGRSVSEVYVEEAEGRAVLTFLGKGGVLRRPPGKDGIYSSSEKQAAGRERSVGRTFWADEVT